MKNKINFPNLAYFFIENEGKIYRFPGRNVFVSCPSRSGNGQNIEQTERFYVIPLRSTNKYTDKNIKKK